MLFALPSFYLLNESFWCLSFAKNCNCLHYMAVYSMALSFCLSFFLFVFVSLFSPSISFSFPPPGFLWKEGVKRKKLNPSIEQEVGQSGAFFSHFPLSKNPPCSSFLFPFHTLTIACLNHIPTHTNESVILNLIFNQRCFLTYQYFNLLSICHICFWFGKSDICWVYE